MLGHAEQRRDADAAADQKRVRCIGLQREFMGQLQHTHRVPYGQLVVDELRSALALRGAQHGDAVVVQCRAGVQQGVAPHAAVHIQGDMRAGFCTGQHLACGVAQHQTHDVGGDGLLVSNHQVQACQGFHGHSQGL
ncbi:hypothetical protein [Comamonas sp. JC664]|uniref:hypothetical protein n=1 Tax=Comamonas sp. JC664 TaxID=2801917 RepID=UPI00360E7C19